MNKLHRIVKYINARVKEIVLNQITFSPIMKRNINGKTVLPVGSNSSCSSVWLISSVNKEARK